ncbi:MAG: hypothetical protein ACE5J3_01045 [Methanosarcinales archaeon]
MIKLKYLYIISLIFAINLIPIVNAGLSPVEVTDLTSILKSLQDNWIVALILVVLGYLLKTIQPSIQKLLEELIIWLKTRISSRFAFSAFEKRYLETLINIHKSLKVRGIKTHAPVAIPLERFI